MNPGKGGVASRTGDCIVGIVGIVGVDGAGTNGEASGGGGSINGGKLVVGDSLNTVSP
ncbi:Uu.00g043460.m01.CDS01 [Anthostomella pinea]|uniref:Uu.00g043460.m01.CDS01 n=1 Tax=Anthostomella pinea TaxID=933095 RepID=A0AAI8VAW6_9PEZI|nr:Uu.00g043460.m01.CDS01 [Anthostomella pinea]